MSNRRRPGNVALQDQFDAAARHLDHNIDTLFPHIARANLDEHDPLHDTVLHALDTALADVTRCCPHIDPTRPAPYVLDLWRGLLSCGGCQHSSQLVDLTDDEEHRCDQCRSLITDDDMHLVVIRIAMVASTAMVCPPCFDQLAGALPQTSTSREDKL